MGKQVLPGVALVAAGLLVGCGQSTTAGQTATSGPSAPATPAAPTSTVAVHAVQASCGGQVPAAVTAVIPGATATYVPKYALGSDCQWDSKDYSHSVIAYAITSMPHRNWAGMQGLSDQTTVSGYPAVRGHSDGNCVVLVNVQNVALEVDLKGIADPTCQATTALAGRVLAAS